MKIRIGFCLFITFILIMANAAISPAATPMAATWTGIVPEKAM